MNFIYVAKLMNSFTGIYGNSLNKDREIPIFAFGLLKINIYCNFVAYLLK